jgi:5-methylthioadenosine/S-adenosylhomocysteine deaminase
MMEIDTLICARWIIQVEPEVQALDRHAIAIDAGRILEVLPADAAKSKFRPRELRELDSHAVLPGLINVHTHAAMTLFRGLADDLPLMDWLNRHIWPAEMKWASPRFVADGSALAVVEMLRGGTTCFGDMYFFPDQTAETAAAAGMRAVIGLVVIDFATAWAKDAGEYLSKGIDVHDRWKQHPLIRTAFAPHSPYTVSESSLRRIGTYAEELDIPIHMHLHESETEIDQSIDAHGKRPMQRLEELGLLSQRLIAVHMTQLDPEEIAQAARYRINVAHCPESNLKLANGFCPAQELLNSGVNVALGTDGAASNNDLDMLAEMRSAALLAKGITGDPRSLPAAAVLAMATINSAKALGIDQVTGSLIPGKEADLIAVDLGAPETQPVYDPVAQLVYAAGRSQVTDVWVAGRQLLENRELLTIDVETAVGRSREWAEKLRR